MVNDMVDIKYSALFAGQELDLSYIERLLKQGIKVLWFGNEEDAEIINKAEYKDYSDANYLCVYKNPENISIVICDGKVGDNKAALDSLADNDNSFNLDQYLAEHAPADNNEIVEAPAGAGKTKTMIDRILFLMSTVDGLTFSDIAMMTFSNDATDSMRKDLLEALNKKYELTRQIRYFSMMESIADLSSSTIHSFFKRIMSEMGPSLGYGTNISLRSYLKEKKDIVREIINEKYANSEGNVKDSLGMSTYQIQRLATDYWAQLDNKGLSYDEIEMLDWGEAYSEAERIQRTLQYIFKLADERYDKLKYRNNSFSMQDIQHELRRAMDSGAVSQFVSKKYRYVFVDEFQDSDSNQIRIIAKLLDYYKGQLFVVGDLKQSIYRFRGATDTAFYKLRKNMEKEGIDEAQDVVLKKNYRTAKNILEIMNPIFSEWNQQGLIDYETQIEPTRDDIDGEYKQIIVDNDSRRSLVIRELQRIIHLLEEKRENAKKEEKEFKAERIMVLTRQNVELARVKEWCDEAGIVCAIREHGKFYKSDAVLDFVALIESLHYCDEPMYVYNYLNSSYCKLQSVPDGIWNANGDKRRLLTVFEKIDEYKTWKTFVSLSKEKPIFSVLYHIVEQTNPVVNYAIKQKRKYLAQGMAEIEAKQQAKLDSIQYDCDIKKLMSLLRSSFSGERATLYDICGFLRNKISTDKSTDQDIPDIQMDFAFVEGMTVHRSKGLQFDNVFIPFMDFPFGGQGNSEILISNDKKMLGWRYKKGKNQYITNINYRNMAAEEYDAVKRDETRLLYVAMTRAVSGLYCFVTRGTQDADTWSRLLPEERDSD